MRTPRRGRQTPALDSANANPTELLSAPADSALDTAHAVPQSPMHPQANGDASKVRALQQPTLPLHPTPAQLQKSHAVLAKVLEIMRTAGSVSPPPTIDTAPDVVAALFVELNKSRAREAQLRKTLALELQR